MSKGTKKVGITGRYGARYGVKIRNLIRDIETKSKQSSTCPRCQYDSVKRKDTGIWKCRHCGYTFAGGAYLPRTTDRPASYAGKRSQAKDEEFDLEATPDV